MSLLDTLYRSGSLRAMDHALGQTMRRMDRGRDGDAATDAVLTAAALASFAVARGHAAFDPARPDLLCDDAVEWPDPDEWLHALRDSRWVSTPDAQQPAATDAPLVLERGLLYLRRYRQYEHRLSTRLAHLATQPVADPETGALAPLFATLFPDAASTRGDLQARAAALALLQSLLLISGGPGTGKTTTITRVLLLLVAQATAAGRMPPRIALAAPTGRAADRMAESVRHAGKALRDVPGVDAALIDALPTEARTLHRLLGTIPGSPRFRHGLGTPLPYDVIVVDEASMVDLPLMCKLVEAVPDGARLILLGDRDQLPSVEAGDVLAAIGDATGAGDALPPAIASALTPLLGAVPAVPPRAGEGETLAGHHVQLRRGYRQSESLDLAPLATAFRDGDADAALALLRGGGLSGVHFHEDVLDPIAGATRDALMVTWRALVDVDDPAAALALAARARLLTALREGPQGARPLNARIEDALAGMHRAPYFHGRLLLVTENSYRHGLFNGDIGVCLQASPASAPVAWFAGGSEGVRGFHPSALPAHDGAFAMTVHKAQGSEFDNVWLQLPRHDGRGVSRELLYTALTRARREVHVCASEPVLRGALSRNAARVSGLAWRLKRDSSAD